MLFANRPSSLASALRRSARFSKPFTRAAVCSYLKTNIEEERCHQRCLMLL